MKYESKSRKAGKVGKVGKMINGRWIRRMER